MDKYKDIEYDRVWFTSDEHYGSHRHITFSGRYQFNSDIKKFDMIRRVPKSIGVARPSWSCWGLACLAVLLVHCWECVFFTTKHGIGIFGA